MGSHNGLCRQRQSPLTAPSKGRLTLEVQWNFSTLDSAWVPSQPPTVNTAPSVGRRIAAQADRLWIDDHARTKTVRCVELFAYLESYCESSYLE